MIKVIDLVVSILYIYNDFSGKVCGRLNLTLSIWQVAEHER
jgi:hypothetical protein